MTCVIMIGNSDNKLSQNEWAHFAALVKGEIEYVATQVHFYGASNTFDPFQNGCIVFEVKEGVDFEKLKEKIKTVRESFRQDSVAMVSGETQFI